MKLSISEKILWAIYDLSESADDIFDFTYYRLVSVYPEYHEIKRKMRYQKERKKFARFITYLKGRGYIKTKIGKNRKGVLLTPRGMEKILQITIKRTDKKKRRDGKWQMIIFDIPEKYRKTRNRLRRALKELGYQKLQQSVWVCPYDVQKATERLIRFYSAEPWTRLFLIEEIED